MVCQKQFSVEPASIEVDAVDVIINLNKTLWGDAADGKRQQTTPKGFRYHLKAEKKLTDGFLMLVAFVIFMRTSNSVESMAPLPSASHS